MAGFGGAVKLTGESEYRKALKAISQDLKELSAETKLVSAQYASNSKSIEALTAKQTALNKQYEAQSQKVKILKDQYNAMSAEYSKNKANHDALVKSYESESEELARIGKECGTTSDEYKAQAAVVSDLASEVKKSSTNLEQNETQMSKMRTELTNATTEMTKTENELNSLDSELKDTADSSKDFGDEIQDAGEKADKASSGGFTVLKGVLANLASSAIQAALSGLMQLGGAIIDVGKQAITSYADYEQLVGGVETLFGAGGLSLEEYAASVGKTVDEVRGEYDNLMTAQEAVLQNASEAYKTAGLSANEYMETVTSFSAALTSSLGGDTVKAAEVANQALIDMADNANKMGTDMESIQNAYQGFAKQNYTMLDNLKLGYGGTKEEMERLLKDAQEISGIEYNIDNLNDVYSAINVIQTELGITGTTAKEAASTISGSTQMMASAWSNLVTGIADDNADFDSLINDFIDSVMAVADNLLPRIQTAIQGMAKLATSLLQQLVPQIVQTIPPLLQQTLPLLLEAVKSVITTILEVLPEIIPVISDLIPQIVQTIIDLLPLVLDAGIQLIMSLIQGISDSIPQLLDMLPTLITDIVTVLTDNLPLVIDTGIALLTALIDGILAALPQLIDQIPVIVDKLIVTLIDNLPKIIEGGVKLITSLQSGIINQTPKLIAMIPQIIGNMVTTLKNNLPKILASGKEIITSLVNGVKSVLSSIGTAGQSIMSSMLNALSSFPSKMLDVGKNAIKGIWNGINDMKSWITDKVKSLGTTLLNAVKSALGIASPSKVFRDQVGKNIALGIGEGFSDEMANVAKDMQNEIPVLDVGGAEYSSSSLGSGALNYQAMVNAFKEALQDVDVVLDDRQVGKFVKKTVENAIYT